MNLPACLGVLALVYGVIFFLDNTLKSAIPHKYCRILRWSGINVGVFQIRWFTERFNRILESFGSSCPGFLSTWFLIGAVISSLLILPSFYFLITTLTGHFSTDRGLDRVVIQPVLPGINIPNSELGYYFVSLLICSVYHEIGHAVSAVSENVRILGFGVFVLFIVPAAYVDLPTEQLKAKSKLQRLRVFSAGVWHNVILVCFSYFVIQSFPVISSVFYSHGASFCVTHVAPLSSVTGPSGIKPGDEIISISGFRTKNKNDFRNAIVSVMQEGQKGFCVSAERLEDCKMPSTLNDEQDCCRNSTSSLCFDVEKGSRTCLHVRKLLSHVNQSCTADLSCDNSNVCVRPFFVDNSTKFVQVERRHDKDFLFVGNPALIYTSMEASNYCPRNGYVSLGFPEMLLKMCNYLISFSGALAVLNVIPSVMLDGQHMMRVLLEIFLVGEYTRYRDNVQFVLTLFGTLLVLANFGIGLYTLLTVGSAAVF